MENASNNHPKSLEEFLRCHSKGILDIIGRAFFRLGIHPNTITIIGLIGNFIGAWQLAIGNLTVGGIIILICGPLDALDGTLARLRGEIWNFGAFIDSVTDRYSELIILGGLLIHFLLINDPVSCVGVFLAASGSVLVSYTKARAEALGYTAKVGILTRVERYLVLAPLLVINQPIIGIWIIAVLANFTALQRIWFVRKQAYSELKK